MAGATQTLRLTGDALSFTLDALLSCRVTSMRSGETKRGFFLDSKGQILDTVSIRFVGRKFNESRGWEDEFLLFSNNPEIASRLIEKAAKGAKNALGKAGISVPSSLRIESAPPDSTMAVEELPIDCPAAAEYVDAGKPFFVGQSEVYRRFAPPPLPEFVLPEIKRPKTLPKSVLVEKYESKSTRWGPFGSAVMPIEFSGIEKEHVATRCAAALYDVSHMLPITVIGRDGRAFLELVLGNSIAKMQPGECKYSSLSLPDGRPLDDLYIYYLEREKTSGGDVFLVVANSGHETDYELFKAVAAGRVRIDDKMPGKRFEGEVEFVTSLENSRGEGRWGEPLYSVALQGPRSLEILGRLAGAGEGERISKLRFNRVVTDVELSGIRGLVISRTGYTGEQTGYEIYATVDRLRALWSALDTGCITLAGLGARDSTRQEAGLPLFGHEIDGELRVPFSGTRYRRLVDFRKPFFAGRRGAAEREEKRTDRVFLLSGETQRKVSAGWPVYDEGGKILGSVTSTSTMRPGKTDCCQAYLCEEEVEEGTRVFVVPPRKLPKPGERPDGRAFVITTWDKSRDYGEAK